MAQEIFLNPWQTQVLTTNDVACAALSRSDLIDLNFRIPELAIRNGRIFCAAIRFGSLESDHCSGCYFSDKTEEIDSAAIMMRILRLEAITDPTENPD